MTKLVSIDPVTRIEGHLAVRVEVEQNKISKGYCSGEMFRGFEIILKGRDPLDAQQITQRICGVCPVSHGMASILAQDDAYGITPPRNGRIIRNLILSANYIQSHILHFYHLAALDFVDIAAVLEYAGKDPMLNEVKAWVLMQTKNSVMHPAAPFLPRYEGDYIEDTELNIAGIRHYLHALRMRRQAHKAGAIFAGKLPHAASLVPGGVTEHVTAQKIAAYISIIQELIHFIDSAYIPDVLEVAKAFPDYFSLGKGPGNFLSYGVFPESNSPDSQFLPSGVVTNGKLQTLDPSYITEDVENSYFSSPSGLHPSRGQTSPNPDKNSSYSWLKAPRYQGKAMEVGPLARILAAYHSKKNPKVNQCVDDLLKQLNATPEHLNSVMGRHGARAIECKLVADRCLRWVDQLKPDAPAFTDYEIPASASGMGLTEAPRGALGHWISIDDHKISNYQCVVPTTWNCSPRDGKGRPGPVEKALEGAPVSDEKNPIEAARIVRSFDPCIACAVH